MNKLTHVAIIPDGNRRYAKKQNIVIYKGYYLGFQNILNIAKYSLVFKIKYLSVFCFSCQNFKRDFNEIILIFKVLEKIAQKILNDSIFKNKINIKFLGNLNFVSLINKKYRKDEKIRKIFNNLQITIKSLERLTKNNKELKLVFFLNYGGKEEIINAILKANKLKPNILTKNNVNNLFTSSLLPEIDILIRTGNEFRISNFLLWKLSYAELFFKKKMWPEFSKKNFKKIILEFYTKRKRNFGK